MLAAKYYVAALRALVTYVYVRSFIGTHYALNCSHLRILTPFKRAKTVSK